MDMNMMSVEIAKLRLEPGDILIIKSEDKIPQGSIDMLQRFVGKEVKVIGCPFGIEFSVITQQMAQEEGVVSVASAPILEAAGGGA